jgi:ubiquinone/menaquinone biosynthesis C-methylase UbiE
MSFYATHIWPRVTDLVMRHREFTRYREHIVPQARGTVLEVGVGSGLNLPFYGRDVDRLYALDPSRDLLRMTRRKMAAARFHIELIAESAELLPLADQSIDTVVTTFTVCSIGEPLQALREMRRVLKPGGTLLFAEHGLAPELSVQRWQHRLNPLWHRISGGCNLDRKTDALIAAAGFNITEITTEYAKGPRPMSYVFSGSAVPSAEAIDRQRAAQ